MTYNMFGGTLSLNQSINHIGSYGVICQVYLNAYSNDAEIDNRQLIGRCRVPVLTTCIVDNVTMATSPYSHLFSGFPRVLESAEIF